MAVGALHAGPGALAGAQQGGATARVPNKVSVAGGAGALGTGHWVQGAGALADGQQAGPGQQSPLTGVLVHIESAAGANGREKASPTR